LQSLRPCGQKKKLTGIMLPDFIVAGTQKGGTTSLHYYLDQHPDIFMPREECHYYDKSLHMGLQWYEGLFVKGQGKIVGEETPAYMFYPDVPRRIYQDNPGVKLIFMLRNPVTRAYSEYWMTRLAGDEPYSFAKAIQVPERRYLEYLSRGRYAEQIKTFQEYFPQEQMFFIISEEFAVKTQECLARLLAFLGVNDNYVFRNLRRRHVGGYPRSELLLKLTAIPNYFKKNTQNLKGKLLLIYFLRILQAINRGKGYPPMAPETKRYLEAYFKEPNRELERVLGREIPEWG
jgi:hypothetical protein